MFELLIKNEIASAHFLRGYEGKCKNMHGHTWKIEVVVAGEQLDHLGMVVDFAQLKMRLKEFLTHMDHVCLNEMDYFKDVNPTAENIAKYIYEYFGQEIDPLGVKKVTVWESDMASATYYQ